MRKDTPYNEQDLLLRLANGDAAAFNEIYTHTNQSIYNIVFTYVKSEAVAKDIVQELYIRLWNKRTTLSAILSLDDYLFITARNATLDYFRKHTVRQKMLASLKDMVPVIPDPAQQVQSKEYEQMLQRAVNALPPQQRQAWLLAQEQEMSYQQIADQMQISRLTVKRHLELARRFVREYINSHLHTNVVAPAALLVTSLTIH